jgi:hypothetical protein
MRTEHDVLTSTLRVTFDCGCWFLASDEFVFEVPKDLDISFNEFCLQVERAHSHEDGPRRLVVTLARVDGRLSWSVAAYVELPPDPKFTAMCAKLDEVMKGLLPRVCEACGAAVPRDQPITVCLDGRVLCPGCRDGGRSGT